MLSPATNVVVLVNDLSLNNCTVAKDGKQVLVFDLDINQYYSSRLMSPAPSFFQQKKRKTDVRELMTSYSAKYQSKIMMPFFLSICNILFVITRR